MNPAPGAVAVDSDPGTYDPGAPKSCLSPPTLEHHFGVYWPVPLMKAGTNRRRTHPWDSLAPMSHLGVASQDETRPGTDAVSNRFGLGVETAHRVGLSPSRQSLTAAWSRC